MEQGHKGGLFMSSRAVTIKSEDRAQIVSISKDRAQKEGEIGSQQLDMCQSP